MDPLPNIPSKQDAPSENPPQAAPRRAKGSLPALIVSIAAFLIVLFVLLSQGFQKTSSPEDAELALLRAEVEKKRLALGLSGSSASSAQDNALFLAQKLVEDGEALQKVLAELMTQKRRHDALLLSKTKELENAALARQALTSELSTLTKRLEELQRSQGQNAALERQLEDSKLLLSAANEELSRLRELLKEAPSQSALQASLDQLAIANQEVARLKEALSETASQADLRALREENRTLKQSLQALRAELSRKRLFAEDTRQLSPNALRLHARLVSLEGLTNQERLAQYSAVKDELNAEVVETVAFETGSASVAIEKVNVILSSLEQTSSNSEYLIVGYASKSGDLDTNRDLSSKRATTVASLADQLRGENQTVKAVYLGQTDRFSQTNDYANQVCEIWELTP